MYFDVNLLSGKAPYWNPYCALGTPAIAHVLEILGFVSASNIVNVCFPPDVDMNLHRRWIYILIINICLPFLQMKFFSNEI